MVWDVEHRRGSQLGALDTERAGVAAHQPEPVPVAGVTIDRAQRAHHGAHRLVLRQRRTRQRDLGRRPIGNLRLGAVLAAAHHPIARIRHRRVAAAGPAVEHVPEARRITTLQPIPARAAEQRVAAAAAGQRVVAAAAVEPIGLAAADQPVSGRAAEHVLDVAAHVVVLAGDAVVSAAPDRHPHPGHSRAVVRSVNAPAPGERVGVPAAVQEIVARATEQPVTAPMPAQHVGTRPAVEHVVAEAPEQRVVAPATVDHIVATARADHVIARRPHQHVITLRADDRAPRQPLILGDRPWPPLAARTPAAPAPTTTPSPPPPAASATTVPSTLA